MSRGDRIRTCDLCVPNAALYQTEPHLEIISLTKTCEAYGWGIGIRTPTNRVRVCRATVTQFPNDSINYSTFPFICQLFSQKNFFISKLHYNFMQRQEIAAQLIYITADPFLFSNSNIILCRDKK